MAAGIMEDAVGGPVVLGHDEGGTSEYRRQKNVALGLFGGDVDEGRSGSGVGAGRAEAVAGDGGVVGKDCGEGVGGGLGV